LASVGALGDSRTHPNSAAAIRFSVALSSSRDFSDSIVVAGTPKAQVSLGFSPSKWLASVGIGGAALGDSRTHPNSAAAIRFSFVLSCSRNFADSVAVAGTPKAQVSLGFSPSKWPASVGVGGAALADSRTHPNSASRFSVALPVSVPWIPSQTLIHRTPSDAAAGAGTSTSIGVGYIAIIAAALALVAIVGVVCGLMAWRRRQAKSPSTPAETTEDIATITEFNAANELDFENPLASDAELGSDFAHESADLDETTTVLL
jgi:hypothetical protein